MAAPIVVIGAPRSGTNMLRDLLTAIPGLGLLLLVSFLTR